MDSNQSAARQARRFLAETVRNDWSWPVTPGPRNENATSDDELQGVSEFRERFYGTPSESENDVELDHPPKNPGDAYQFDSPDSVGLVVAAKKDEKLRARRKAMEEEMRWNEGLSLFERRRDEWTGAAAARKRVAKAEALQAKLSPRKSRIQDEDGKWVLDPESSEATKSPQDSGMEDTHYFADTHIEPISSDAQIQETLIPVAPPLLAQNAIRASISPKVYPDIYNKVVMSGRTPSVPINLSDMTRSLVQGWKEHGEWPPKPGPVDPLAGRRRSIGTVLSNFRGTSDEPFLKAHPHVRRGVESVKKVFRISGSQGSGSSNATPTKETR